MADGLDMGPEINPRIRVLRRRPPAHLLRQIDWEEGAQPSDGLEIEEIFPPKGELDISETLTQKVGNRIRNFLGPR